MEKNQLKAKINALIAQRTKYGVRTENVVNRSVVLVWSNAWNRWYMNRGVIFPGTTKTIRLDANNILVPLTKGVNIKVLSEIVDKLELNELPLASGGFDETQYHKCICKEK